MLHRPFGGGGTAPSCDQVLESATPWRIRMRTMRRAIASLVLVLLVLSATAAAAAGAPRPWRPDMRAALRYVHHRHGNIAFAVRTDRHLWAYHGGRTQPCASVFKGMALVTYLN